MLDKLYDFVNDNEFRFTIYEDKIHLINFQRIISLEENYISVKSKNKRINITGNNLTLKKLLKDEMLVFGTISKIEVNNAR